MKKILQNIYVLVPLVLGLITALRVVSLGETGTGFRDIHF